MRDSASRPDVAPTGHPPKLRDLLLTHGVTLKKHLGQNFLIDRRVQQAIVAASGVTNADGVFEIGPGAGALTALLALRAKRVVAVEKDRSLAPVLRQVLADNSNVDLVFADVLEVDLAKLWQRFGDCQTVHVVANLPYYVTTPILFHLLESRLPCVDLLLMVQREVADRLSATPGGKDYGVLSVGVQYRAQVTSLLRVSAAAFMPPPAVESTVVRLTLRSQPAVAVADEATFFRVVRAAFGTRRKTLRNALGHGLSLSRAHTQAALDRAGIDGGRRGETLSLAEFAALTTALANH